VHQDLLHIDAVCEVKKENFCDKVREGKLKYRGIEKRNGFKEERQGVCLDIDGYMLGIVR
jgi:hypothetical protein